MITAIFLKRFGPVINAWGDKKFPTHVLERIDARTADMTDAEMKTLCELILDHCEHAPSVAKVNEWASVVRNRRDRKPERPAEILSCGKCNDVGIVRVVSRHERFETLARCDCQTGTESAWQLPQWIRDFNPLFERHACPVDWFKPVEVFPSLEALSAAVHRQRTYWQEKIRIAEQYWAANIDFKKSEKKIQEWKL